MLLNYMYFISSKIKSKILFNMLYVILVCFFMSLKFDVYSFEFKKYSYIPHSIESYIIKNVNYCDQYPPYFFSISPKKVISQSSQQNYKANINFPIEILNLLKAYISSILDVIWHSVKDFVLLIFTNKIQITIPEEDTKNLPSNNLLVDIKNNKSNIGTDFPVTDNKRKNLSAVVKILNVQKVLENSIAVNKLNHDISTIRDQIREELAEQERKFKMIEHDLIAQRGKLHDKDLNDKTEKFHREAIDMQRNIQNRKVKLEKNYIKGMNKIYSSLQQVLQEIANSSNIELILTEQCVLFHQIDQSFVDLVITKLNDKIKDVEIEKI